MSNVNYGDQVFAEKNEILRTEAGSGAQGIAIEGRDDHDEMGIFVESKAQMYGLMPEAKTHSWRTEPEGHRSEPGDTDRVIYPFKKYLQLAAKGNPTALVPLFASGDSILILTPLGAWLRSIRSEFLTQECVHRFLGYMEAQRLRVQGLTKRNVPNRPELIEQFGWDVKYGAHALRLAYQGVEVAHKGFLTLPMPKMDRQRCINVKLGLVPKEEVLEEITTLEWNVRDLLAKGQCWLPPKPDWNFLSKFAVSLYELHWKETDGQT